jgi:hypothetical protein
MIQEYDCQLNCNCFGSFVLSILSISDSILYLVCYSVQGDENYDNDSNLKKNVAK